MLPLEHAIDLLKTTMVEGGPLSGAAVGVLAAWTAGGAYLAVRFFRWEYRSYRRSVCPWSRSQRSWAR